MISIWRYFSPSLLCQNHWPLSPPHFSCIIFCLQLVWLYFSSMYTHILNTNFYCFFYNSLQKMRYGMSNLPVTYSIHSVVQWSVSCQKKSNVKMILGCTILCKVFFLNSTNFLDFSNQRWSNLAFLGMFQDINNLTAKEQKKDFQRIWHFDSFCAFFFRAVIACRSSLLYLSPTKF